MKTPSPNIFLTPEEARVLAKLLESPLGGNKEAHQKIVALFEKLEAVTEAK